MKTVLFVCTGNVCRSPMAEALFRRAASGRGAFRALSAGLGAMNDQPPTPHSVQAMRELGVDISSHRSRALTAELVQQADYIFGMTHSHVDTIVLLYPQAADKTFLLREFDETLEPFEKHIADPIGGSYEVYENCRHQIEQGVAVFGWPPSSTQTLEQRDAKPPFQSPHLLPNRRMRHPQFAGGVGERFLPKKFAENPKLGEIELLVAADLLCHGAYLTIV